MENQDMKMGGKTCGCGCHKAFPILIIIFGLIFLLGDLNILSWMFVDVAWPILVIILGFIKLGGSKCGCCAGNGGKM